MAADVICNKQMHTILCDTSLKWDTITLSAIMIIMDIGLPVALARDTCDIVFIYTQRRVQPVQCYFTVQITGINI